MKLMPTSKIFVRNLIVDMNIGALTHERHGRQKVRISVEMTVPTISNHGDKLDQVVPYHPIVDRIHEIIATGHIELVETLSQKIAAAALDEKRVIEVSVTIEKLEVIAGAECAGITLVARQDESA
jgi:dihydroneopterin aldolase